MLLPFFADMAVRPDRYQSGTFHDAFVMAPPRLWGAVIAALCLWVVVRARAPWALIALASAMTAWTVGLVTSFLNGFSEAPFGWTFTGSVALLLVWGAGRTAQQ